MVTQNELFWPSLYGRLAPSRYSGEDADDPASPEEDAFGIERHFVGFDSLRHQVEVELQSLLNATSLEAVLLGALLRGAPSDRATLEDYPLNRHEEVRRSIINYGLPAFIGRNVYSLPVQVIERRLREAIETFEPRIRKATMRVRVEAREARDRIPPDKALEFVIEGEIYGPSDSMRIAIRTFWDPERIGTGVADVELGR